MGAFEGKICNASALVASDRLPYFHSRYMSYNSVFEFTSSRKLFLMRIAVVTIPLNVVYFIFLA